MFDVGTPFLQLFQQYIPQGNLLLADRDDPCLLARCFRRTSAQHEVKCLLSSNILLFLLIGFHLKVQCIIFLKLRYRDIVAFRTKKLNGWEFGHWLTANFTFPAVTWKNIVSSFSMPLWCNKHIPGQSASMTIAFEFFGMFVSTRTPSVCFGEGKVVLVFEIIYLFSTFKLFSMVKWHR